MKSHGVDLLQSRDHPKKSECICFEVYKLHINLIHYLGIIFIGRGSYADLLVHVQKR